MPLADHLTIRSARPGDETGMSMVLTEVLTDWNSTRPGDPAHVLAAYVGHPDRIDCAICEGPEGIVGFQSLRLAVLGNAYEVEPGWGIIGTYVRLNMGRQGIGQALFAHNLRAAQAAGLRWIEATIGADNLRAQAYYDAMGFQTYRTEDGAVRKCCSVLPLR
ncbi:GNAT family N-acetyltransferase [Phaeobacter gallaeciensis]|uniref:Acetyltransferase n=1 Tax=Phaeobacter gallaeciensis TaxID=60890 RepID=A0AAC9Z6P3_9RHOB|nr:GNAT family N-acetyltransferase [Phaeobacter gallaeciensis]AHD08285.1 Acetyltransferase [Phaeobacter gallaeciensis DSM 26640]ATE91551.1 Acetyltransferase [Phaeobacter gallaeciensis]ATE95827.1 Acetyltransferase [Phaeobacter gallaeciensis]ATF00167.1 Acetyltransferase [Phaeobacter gallaeciensis]ATF04599.1 Acetyltransferase [Phaeobacter gallaeciensis]